MHSILLIGQSNMAGRGYENEVEPIVNSRLYVLRNGRWRKMYVPVNPDRATAGISLAESFADRYASERGVDVGLIPCADGGTCLDQWAVGGVLFDHACYMAELAARSSTITAVLWHQGESDSSPERYPFYEEKLSVILAAFRKRLGLETVPILLGGLGDFLVSGPDPDRCKRFKYYHKVNEALAHLASNDEYIGFVSAKGLLSNPDHVHFSAQSLREFGLRYYAEFRKLENKNRTFEEKAAWDAMAQSDLEEL